MTPPTLTHVPLFLTEQSPTHPAIPPRPRESALDSDQCTPDRVDEGVDVEPASNVDVEVTFPGSSCFTSIGLIEKTFFVNEELIPIKI